MSQTVTVTNTNLPFWEKDKGRCGICIACLEQTAFFKAINLKNIP